MRKSNQPSNPAMSPSSIFPHRVMRSRCSLLQRYAGNHNAAPPISCTSANVGNRTIYRSCSSSNENAFLVTKQSRRLLSFQTTFPKDVQQQQLKQHHYRQRGFSSSTAVAAQESSSDAEDNENMEASTPTSQPKINPYEEEIKRRKVKDVSMIK